MFITNNINFMRRQRRKLDKLHALDKQIFYGALVVFSIAVLVVAGTGGYWEWSRRKLISLDEQIVQQERVVSASAGEEAEYLLYTTRLSAIQAIFENRNSKKEALDFLSELLVPSITFDAVDFNNDERMLSFRVEAQDVFSVEVFLDKLREPGMNERIENIEISSIQRDEQARYVMNINIILRESEA